MRRDPGARDLRPRAEAWIEQVARPQRVQNGGILRQMLALPADRAIGRKAEPGHVLDDGGLELGAAAAGVDVLDPQQEAASGLVSSRSGAAEGDQRGAGVPQVEEPGGARREARHDGVALGHGGTAVASAP